MLYAARKMGDTRRGRRRRGRAAACRSVRAIGQAGASLSTVPAAAALELELRARAHRDGPDRGSVGRGDAARGHQVEVVTAHPHYPGALWGRRAGPYRETRNGIPVLRLPLVIGHRTTAERITEEATYASAAAVAAAMPTRARRGRRGLALAARPVAGAGERQGTALPLDPVAGGHPARRGRDHRADARGRRAAHRPAARAVRLSAPPTESS